MNRRAIALLAAGHFLTDLCQGTVPALLPFLVMERHFSYTAAASLVFAISASSSVVQPLFGQVADRLALAWLLPASILLTGAGLAFGAQATTFALVLVGIRLEWPGGSGFHPEAARQAYLASGDRRATGMSWFTVGGVVGFRPGPDADDRSRPRMGNQGSPGLAAADRAGRDTPGASHRWNRKIAGQSKAGQPANTAAR